MTLTVDEAEAEEDAAQTRVRKGSAQPTEEQIMKHNAAHFLLASRKKCQTGHTHGGPILPRRSRCDSWTFSS